MKFRPGDVVTVKNGSNHHTVERVEGDNCVIDGVTFSASLLSLRERPIWVGDFVLDTELGYNYEVVDDRGQIGLRNKHRLVFRFDSGMPLTHVDGTPIVDPGPPPHASIRFMPPPSPKPEAVQEQETDELVIVLREQLEKTLDEARDAFRTRVQRAVEVL